jgi:hypothetical protein
MGLDASVSCRCWQDGLTTPPPVPRELIVCTEEDGLDLSIPYDGNEDLYRAFDNWVESWACDQEGMRQACVHVSNWSGYRLFQQAVHPVHTPRPSPYEAGALRVGERLFARAVANDQADLEALLDRTAQHGIPRKRQNATVIRLARHRCQVILAVLRTGQPNQPACPAAALADAA